MKKDLTFKQAVKYSAARIVRTRGDSGSRVINFAGLLGPLAGEALANTYTAKGEPGSRQHLRTICFRHRSEVCGEPDAPELAASQSEAAPSAARIRVGNPSVE